MLLITYILQGSPVTINKAYSYSVRTRLRFYSKVARLQHSIIQSELIPYRDKLKDYRRNELLLEINWHSNRFFSKDGTIKNIDVSNILKLLEDAIYPILGIDDSQNFKVVLEKFVDIKEFVEINILTRENEQKN